MQKINILQETFPQDWDGMTSENNLHAILGMKKVQNASEFISRMTEANYGENINSYLRKFGVKKLKSEDDFRWMMQGREEKNIALTEARLTATGSAISATDQTGLGVTRFYLLFPERFHKTALIIGNRDVYTIRVVADPIAEGTSWLHECELFTGDITAFIPYDELLPNTRFSVEWNSSEQTLSKEGGTASYTSPFSFKNVFTNLRMQELIPGNMLNNPVEFGWVVSGKNGKPEYKKSWMEYRDWVFEKTFELRKCRAIIHARPNMTPQGTYLNIGSSNFIIRQGAGIRCQMETSNQIYYSNFSIPRITEAIITMSQNQNPNFRKCLMRTGDWGLYQFHEALKDYASLYTPLFDQNRIQYNGDMITVRGTFFKYKGPNGVELTVMHEPMADDDIRNKILSSMGPGLAESRRYDIFFTGGDNNGEPNVQIVEPEKDATILKFIPGMRHPFVLNTGNNGGYGLAAVPDDGYWIHREDIFGTMVKNPKLTAAFIPSELA